MPTKDQVAQTIISEAKARNHTRDECLAEMSALYQESQWDETIWDATHTTYGVAQQDGSYPRRFDGVAAQIKAFFDKLDLKRTSPGHADIWLNICWLQQAPNWPSAQYWWEHGRQAYLTEIKSRIATVTPYLDRYWPTTDQPTEETAVGFTGDPVWLEDVLRQALGDRLVVEGDWASRGTGGTMGDIWGVLIHHTGNSRETVAGIRDGRSDLSGPLSQCLITPDGRCHLIAVGPCNHAGIGSYPGIGTNNGNQRLIGFECAWPTIRSDGSYDPGEKWPDAQILTMRDATAAVLKKLAADSSHVIGHKEWATKPPNVKWDPGNMDMNWFRGEVGKDLAGQFDAKPTTPPVIPTGPATPATPPANPEADIWDQLRGRWEMLGWQTAIETLAELRDKITGTQDAGKPGFTRGNKPQSKDVA